MSSDRPRTLILLRHGKSAYPEGVRDQDRPLADRGRREAALAGEHIRVRLGRVDRVLCSTARRARETLDATGLAAGAAVEYFDEIYATDWDEILQEILAVPESTRTLLVIGHAPGIPELADELAGAESDRASLIAMSDKFPTSAFAVIAVEGPWTDLPDGGLLIEFVVARHHPKHTQEKR